MQKDELATRDADFILPAGTNTHVYMLWFLAVWVFINIHAWKSCSLQNEI